ncbi:hypothetical protein [Rhizobium rhizogenes]|uniref:hypothetical protein n=1 Tax=Rhizobium rhizogenes TaxID=359 RepID=UPI001572DBFB|nr:hypothetical protein [Rhizobium rhizogenes]NTG07112.1 hypothetical protein [Rhizobium rhizogenes]
MTTEIQSNIDTMKAAIDAAAARIGSDKDLMQNREALKTMMFNLMNGLSNLVYAVGAESMYIPDAGYLSDDIDSAFHDVIEAYDAASPTINFKQYSTLDHRTQGLSAYVRVPEIEVRRG